MANAKLIYLEFLNYIIPRRLNVFALSYWYNVYLRLPLLSRHNGIFLDNDTTTRPKLRQWLAQYHVYP